MDPSEPSLPSPAPFAPPTLPTTPTLQTPSAPSAPPAPPAPPATPATPASPAPPTLQSPPFASPESFPEHATTIVVPVAQSQSRRGVLIGTLGVLTVAAVAVGAFAFLSNAPDDVLTDDVLTDDAVELATETPERTQGFSYAAASADARVAASMSLDMTIDVAEGLQTIEARIDRASGRVEMELDLSQIDQGEADFAVDGPVGMIIDEPSNTVYLTANLLGGFFGANEEGWLRVDSNEFSDDSSGFDQMFTNPLAITDVLGNLDPVDLGQETVNGELLQHFRVSVDGETLAEVSGSNANVFGGDLVDAMDVTYDVWVSEDDRVRRIEFVALDPASQDRASVSMDIETSTEAIGIDIPNPDEVIDLDELFGQMTTDIEG